MADSSWDDSGIVDVIDSVDFVDTGNSTSADIVDLTDVVNAPSVINNTGSIDENTPPAPDFSFASPSANGVANIVSSLSTEADLTAPNPFLDQLWDMLQSVDGPTQVKNPSSTSTGSNNKSSNSPIGGALSTAAKAAAGVIAPAKAATPKQTPSTDPISKFLLGNASNSVSPVTNGSLNWNNLAIILTVITSLIIIWIFIKKGHT